VCRPARSFPLPGLPFHARVSFFSHLRIGLEGPDGGRLDAMAFRAAEADLGLFLMKERGQTVHLAGTLSADSWQGTQRIQFRVIDAAKAF